MDRFVDAIADMVVIRGRIGNLARQEIEAGAPLLPLHVVDRIADGENALRVIREWRDETAQHLAFRTNLDESHIADIESGRVAATEETLRRLGDALRVPSDLLA